MRATLLESATAGVYWVRAFAIAMLRNITQRWDVGQEVRLYIPFNMCYLNILKQIQPSEFYLLLIHSSSLPTG